MPPLGHAVHVLKRQSLGLEQTFHHLEDVEGDTLRLALLDFLEQEEPRLLRCPELSQWRILPPA